MFKEIIETIGCIYFNNAVEVIPTPSNPTHPCEWVQELKKPMISIVISLHLTGRTAHDFNPDLTRSSWMWCDSFWSLKNQMRVCIFDLVRCKTIHEHYVYFSARDDHKSQFK